MTCPCKAELAAMLLEVLEVGRASSYGVDRERFDHAQPFRDMKDAVMRRLSPAPAEPSAEPQEPCMVVEYQDGTADVLSADRKMFWSARGNGWLQGGYSQGGGAHRTRSAAEAALPAARAALLAASEPGQAAPTTGTTNTRPYAAVVADGKPAPAPFDAAKWAEKMVGWNSFWNCWSLWDISGVNKSCTCNLPGEREFTGSVNITATRKAIAAALTAAHEAGKASPSAIKSPEGEWDSIADLLSDYAAYRRALEAASLERIEAGKAEAGQPRPRRWPDRWGMHDDRVLRWNEKHAVWLSCQTAHLADGDIYLPQPPAPPAEKEGPR